MKTAFDFSKVKKAGRAKSMNDMYAGGIPGSTNPEQSYGDTIGESKIKGTVEKFKNNNTKKRVLRQYYGNDTKIDESESEDIKQLRDFKPGIDEPSQYIKDYFNDFWNRALQSQPYVPGRLVMDREYGETFMPKESFQTAIGEMPSLQEKKRGIGGSVNLPVIDKNNKVQMGNPDLISVHSHPDDNSFNTIDKERNSLLLDRKNYFGSPSYMVSGKGNVIKYNRDPKQDLYSTDLIDKLNKLYYRK